MPNRKARRAALQAKAQKAKIKKTDDGSDPTADHANNTFQEHDPTTRVAEGPPAQPNPVDSERKPPESTKKPKPLEAIMKLWEFIKRPDHANAIMAVFTVFIFFGTVAYAVVALFQWCAMRQANKISRDSLESVQRAFVTFQALNGERLTEPTPNSDLKWIEFKIRWENSGNTPALNVVQRFWVQEIKREPTEAEFVGPNPLPPEASTNPIGPKAPLESASQWFPEKDFIVPIPNRPPGERREAAVDTPTAFWGWVIYRDVFNETPVRLTEFCDQLTRITIPDNPNSDLSMNFQRCKEHNCEDSYCPDYKSLVELTKPLMQQQ